MLQVRIVLTQYHVCLILVLGASGQDIEDALKEMKSMQALLDEANSEIQILRSQGKSCVS